MLGTLSAGGACAPLNFRWVRLGSAPVVQGVYFCPCASTPGVGDEHLAIVHQFGDSLYVNVNGESGYFDRELAVYGREGLPCRRCGAPIRREAFMNRSSFSCPRCQPRPRKPLR